MGDAPFGAQAGFAVYHRREQLIRVYLALHQHAHLASTREGDGLFGGGVAVGNIDDPDVGQGASDFLRNRLDFGAGADENRDDYALRRGLKRALQ